MAKPLTYYKPNGEWGIEGVDLHSLPAPVYGALSKLMRLEHPIGDNKANALRLSSDEEMAALLSSDRCNRSVSIDECVAYESCIQCWLDWLLSPA